MIGFELSRLFDRGDLSQECLEGSRIFDMAFRGNDGMYVITLISMNHGKIVQTLFFNVRLSKI